MNTGLNTFLRALENDGDDDVVVVEKSQSVYTLGLYYHW